MTTEQLKNYFERKGFIVHTWEEENGTQAEIEDWTDGGVDMIIYLSPFNEAEFFSYVDDFDVDELIDLHRKDPSYVKAFSISESLKDLTKFHKRLREIRVDLEYMLEHEID